MDAETFRNLPTTEVARLVRASGSKVCVFPSNGTRRWFMLEHLASGEQDLASYVDIACRHHIEIFKMFFEHGLDTLLVPFFGPDLLKRGEDYAQLVIDDLARPAIHPDFKAFYDAYRVRVRFYGDYDKFLAPTPYTYMADMFEQATVWTQSHDRYRLFFGLFAHDATETVAKIAVRFYQEHNRLPDKRQIIEAYYGEYVGPVDLFIGFDKFSVFDMPLLSIGNEDLYFTVSPSPYITQRQLRDILYDHLYSRQGDPEYAAMSPDDWARMGAFYQANLGKTMGVGTKHKGVWYPLSHIDLLSSLDESDHEPSE